jgi:uncharacterized damage-inducible protein DinB
METVRHLGELFGYDYWANRQILDFLKSNSDEKSRRIFAHLLITEKEYFERLRDKDSTEFDFWQDLSLENCERLLEENAENFKCILEGAIDETLDKTAKYKTSKGVRHENTWRELLTQILFHSATHRGNIIVVLREAGFTPPPVDYIIFLRETCLTDN